VTWTKRRRLHRRSVRRRGGGARDQPPDVSEVGRRGRLVLCVQTKFGVREVYAAPIPGGTLSPTSIPQFVRPLIIAPAMPTTGSDAYKIAVRQFNRRSFRRRCRPRRCGVTALRLTRRTSTISGFDHFSTFDRVRARRGGDAPRMHQPTAFPIDVYRNGEEFIVELDVPGMDPSTINVDVERNMLTVTGEAHPQHEDVDEALVCERPHTRFRRQLYLGDNSNLRTSRPPANWVC
jgi:HSP20 family protein